MTSALDNNFLSSNQNTIVCKVIFYFIFFFLGGDMYRVGPTYGPKETWAPLDITPKIKNVYI